MHLLLTVELVTETLGLVLEAAAPLTVNLGLDEAASVSFAFSLGVLAWLRSSSQEPMVAARLASLPLLPREISEETEGLAAGWASNGVFIVDTGIQSEGTSQASEKGETISLLHVYSHVKNTDVIWNFRIRAHLRTKMEHLFF